MRAGGVLGELEVRSCGGKKMIPYFVLTLCSDTDADTDTYVACEIDETDKLMSGSIFYREHTHIIQFEVELRQTKPLSGPHCFNFTVPSISSTQPVSSR